MEMNAIELNSVSGGSKETWQFGMNCSQNQMDAIGGVVTALGAIPVIGGALAAAAVYIGRAFCGGL